MKYEYKLFLRVLFIFLFNAKIMYYLFFIPTIIFPYLILKIIGFNIMLDFSNSNLYLDNIILNFISACVASTAYHLLLILILLTKVLNIKKIVSMFLLGSLMILAINIIRVVVLSYTFINYGYEAFNSLHLLLWRGAASVIVFLIWIILIKIYKPKAIPVISDLIYLYNLVKKKKRARK